MIVLDLEIHKWADRRILVASFAARCLSVCARRSAVRRLYVATPDVAGPIAGLAVNELPN